MHHLASLFMRAEDQTQDVMLVQQTLYRLGYPQPMVTVPNCSLSLLHKLYISTGIHVQEKQYCLLRSEC